MKPAVMAAAALRVAQVVGHAAVDVVVLLVVHSGCDGQCCSQLLQQSKRTRQKERGNVHTCPSIMIECVASERISVVVPLRQRVVCSGDGDFLHFSEFKLF